jgi:hypothetical protein
MSTLNSVEMCGFRTTRLFPFKNRSTYRKAHNGFFLASTNPPKIPFKTQVFKQQSGLFPVAALPIMR